MRHFSLLLSLFLYLSTLIACSDKPIESIDNDILKDSLSPQPEFEYVVDERVFSVDGESSLILDFPITEQGYLKLLAYDSTEYTEYIENSPMFYVSFYDENNNVIHENISISEGYLDKYIFEPGNIKADITYLNAPDNISDVTISWAFAPASEKPIDIVPGKKVAAAANSDNTCQFSLKIEQDGLYKITCAEACIWESDCKFFIRDEDNQDMTGELSIHGTEWISRLVFLPKGTYQLTVTDIQAVSTCEVVLEEKYEDISTEAFDNMTVPATVGFTLETLTPFKVSFSADGSQQFLRVTSYGTNTYYDWRQTFDIIIRDSNDMIVYEEECVEEIGRWDISEYKGEYTLEINPHQNGVVTICTENS